ncbi:MAG TPA: DNA-binding protein, partial [Thermomonospora sp.]|nr:DNA-binding protein [Thermomonospora sp.]
MSEAEELLAAGAVLAPGTEGAGDRAVPLTARAYRHPVLDDRVVVRLVADELGAAEDLAAGFLGLEPVGEPAVVGLGPRVALGFPEWVLVHHPEDGHHALAVVPEMEHTARRAKSKPQAALEAYLELAERLAAAVPHFLPTFYEQAGREFLAVENPTFAARMFTRARQAEVEYGLPIDEERLDGVFLEFALAGALPVKALSGYARELAARVPADEALRRFLRLCARRTAGGLAPSVQMANDLRRLARAAGQDTDEVQREHVLEMLALPATARAPKGWWKAHRPTIVALARQRPEVRGALLRLMPAHDDGLPELWLEILEESGATAALCDPGAVPEEARCEDGSAGWLERFLTFVGTGWYADPPPPALYGLVERMAGRLRAELADRDAPFRIPSDLNLLDLLLTLDVPVADPAVGHSFALKRWAEQEDRRDLTAVAADPRWRRPFHQGAEHISDDQWGRRTLRALADSPGGRPLLASWMAEVARRSAAVGLPKLPDALERLGWLPGDVLALAEDEVRAAANADLAAIVARTLRTGLFDELVWPAWEEAATALVAPKDVDALIVAEAWPYLVVGSRTQARVIDADGTVLTHDLRIPANDTSGDPGFHYVDGELLVHWRSARRDHDLMGYWHTAADRPQPMQGSMTRGTRMNWYLSGGPVSLPLPGGGRATGGGVLHRGDTALPQDLHLVTDGTGYWVWHWDGTVHDWYEYDPASGARGRRSKPAFFSDLPPDTSFVYGRLVPVSTTEATPVGAPVNGLLGWRVVRLPDGTQRGETLAGDTVPVPDGGWEATVLFVPGDDRPRTAVAGHYQVELRDAEGVITSVARTDGAPGPFGEGTAILPPLRYWHCLRPRDPRGSAALRRIDDATVGALLKAAVSDGEDLTETVRTLLPDITHEALRAGVVGILKYAAAQQELLDATAERLERALTTGIPDEGPSGPADRLLHDAVNGLAGTGNAYWYNAEEDTNVLAQLRAMAAARDVETATEGIHLDGEPLPWSRLPWVPLLDGCAALAYRAVIGLTAEEHREALGDLLREFRRMGLVGSDRWRMFRLFLDRSVLTTPSGDWRDGSLIALLPLGDGAFLAFFDSEHQDNGVEFTALFHDPAGRFDVPAPYTVRSSAPVGTPEEAERLDAVLAEGAARGPAPWFPEAVEEFARLTGTTRTMAALVVAGLPSVGTYDRNFLPSETRG